MHEAGIAASIIEIAVEAAQARGSGRIRAIGLQLGAFTGVVPEALEFAFQALRANTPAEEARLEIHRVPLIVGCPDCGWSGPPEEDFCLVCPRCSNPVSILTGREMQVEFVDLDVEGEINDGTGHSGNQSPPQERRICRDEPPAF